jgi:hypothetical protein
MCASWQDNDPKPSLPNNTESLAITASTTYLLEILEGLRKGSLVFHKTEGYIGTFDGFTKIPSLFEFPTDTRGCRILLRIPPTPEPKIASPENIVLHDSLSLEERHRAILRACGKCSMGIRNNATHRPRVAHCWFCKAYLNNAVNYECVACNWILCACGACGCGFK